MTDLTPRTAAEVEREMSNYIPPELPATCPICGAEKVREEVTRTGLTRYAEYKCSAALRVGKEIPTANFFDKCPKAHETVIQLRAELAALRAHAYVWAGSDPFTGQQVLDLLGANAQLRARLDALTRAGENLVGVYESGTGQMSFDSPVLMIDLDLSVMALAAALRGQAAEAPPIDWRARAKAAGYDPSVNALRRSLERFWNDAHAESGGDAEKMVSLLAGGWGAPITAEDVKWAWEVADKIGELMSGREGELQRRAIAAESALTELRERTLPCGHSYDELQLNDADWPGFAYCYRCGQHGDKAARDGQESGK